MSFSHSDSLPSVLPQSDRFKFGSPKYADGFVFGFLFRLLIAVFAVIVPIPIFLVAGFFVGDSNPSSITLAFFGGFIVITILVGEHLRSRVYERTIVHRRKNQLRGKRSLDELKTELGTEGHDTANPNIKRVVDIASATAGLILLAPLIIAVSLLVSLELRGPILDRQERRGLDGRRISILKFRTRRDDGSLTSAAPVLRASSFDKLPQLFNVIWGDISIVGISQYQYEDYDTREVAKQASKRGIKPGIISLALFMPDRLTNPNLIAADLYYVKNRSLWMDFRMMLQAIGAVLHP
jgi:lipopolysaccharide/colanic/teichoic acid biosynthesis glycosyltransferase